MRTRDTRHTAKVRGTSSVPPWRKRECRRCPGKAWGHCFSWNVSRESWERMDGPHAQRRSPNGTNHPAPPDASHEIASCGSTETHAYHWTRPGETWCRGRI